METKIVISDLHIGENNDLDIFSGEEQLIELLENMRRKDSVEIIINGDFIDFLTVVPLGGNDRKTTEIKLNRVYEKRTKIFLKFKEFLEGTDHKLTVIIGNHDIEFILPEIQYKFKELMGGEYSKVNFINSQAYVMSEYINEIIHIEHGNRFDWFNDYSRKQVVKNQKLGAIDFCPGSHLVNQVFNHLALDLPFINKVRSKRLAFILIWLIDKKALVPLFSELLAVSGRETVNSLSLFFLKVEEFARLFQTRKTLSLFEKEKCHDNISDINMLAKDMASTFYGDISGSNETDLAQFIEFLNAYPTSVEAQHKTLSIAGTRYIKFIKKWLSSQIVDLSIEFSTKESITHFEQYDEGKTMSFEDKLYLRHANEIMRQSQSYQKNITVIFGHTHEKVMHEKDGVGRYINSGTWAKKAYMENVPGKNSSESEIANWLEKLKKGQGFSYRSEPTFVEIIIDNNTVQNVALKTI